MSSILNSLNSREQQRQPSPTEYDLIVRLIAITEESVKRIEFLEDYIRGLDAHLFGRSEEKDNRQLELPLANGEQVQCQLL